MKDDIYKRMVLALPHEFFDGWQWQEGDYFIRVWNNRESIHVIGDSELTPELYPGLTVGDQSVFMWDGFIRPLPSQKQLQKICMTQINCSPHDLLRFFEAWLYEDEVIPAIDFEDFDDLWLKYTEWVCERKEWDGEKWI